MRRFLALLAVALPACTAPEPAADPLADIAAFDALQAELDQARVEYLGEAADEQRAIGRSLYWQDTTTEQPRLRRDLDGARVSYTFDIGRGLDLNYRASASTVATARPTGDGVSYQRWAADQPGTLRSEVLMPAPGAGVKWWPYDVVGQDLYMIVGFDEHVLTRYPASGAAPVAIVSLEAAGCDVEELWDFAITGDSALFIESGRIWSLDLASLQATWLGNQTEAYGGGHDSHGTAYISADGPFFIDATTGVEIDLTQAIAEADFSLSPTFAAAHHYTTDATWYGRWMIYVGVLGVFAYDMVDGDVRPVLLDNREGPPYFTYRYPTVTTDGTLYVTGLAGASGGSSGADGPIFAVDLTAIL